MKRIIIESYTPPHLAKYPDDVPIFVGAIVLILLVPIVFVCAWMWL